jgi:DNA-binding NtrC family response regulator
MEYRVAPATLGDNAPTILVVEDDDDTRELWELLFEEEGFQVRSARNAAEGLTLLLRSDVHIDVIFTDYGLGDGTGEAMLRMASEAGALEGRPSILCTANHGIRTSAFARVVYKPISADDAIGHVRAALDGGRCAVA